MSEKVNYHIHSTHSDGELSVARLVAELKSLGVKSFSITDHDCITANYEAMPLVIANNMKYFNGIELSCCVDDDMGLYYSAYCHILGLGFDIALMEKENAGIIERRNKILNDFILRLQKDGYNISPKEVYLSKKKWKDRTAIAKILMQKHGYASVSEVFEKVINIPQYVEYSKISPSIKDAIDIIHRAKGIAIWAHPLEYTCGGKKDFSWEQVKILLQKMIGYGLNGIEVYYQRFSKEEILFLEKLGTENNLIASIGTDFHCFIEEKENSPFQPQRLDFCVEGVNLNTAIYSMLELNEWYQNNNNKTISSKQKFNNKANAYESARPSYPKKVIDVVFDNFVEGESFCIADIGSGTGKLTDLLLERNGVSIIYAVEPNADMRAVAEEKLSKHANFVSVNATAERTTLPEKSIDLIIVAQAFHWFDKTKFKTECGRILKDDGNVVLMWNRKDTTQDITKDTNVVYEKYCSSYKGYRGGGGLKQIESEIASFYDGEVVSQIFNNYLEYNINGFVQMNLSQSYSLTKNDENFNKFVDEIKEVFNKYQHYGKVKITNKTYVYWRVCA